MVSIKSFRGGVRKFLSPSLFVRLIPAYGEMDDRINKSYALSFKRNGISVDIQSGQSVEVIL